MNSVATFDKVSLDQYAKDRVAFFGEADEETIVKEWRAIKLPVRATSGSAGYDFFLPLPICFDKNSIVIPTGIRCLIEHGWFLYCCPKSGLGFKHRMALDNTCGVVDEDYYFSANQGHILAKIHSKQPFHLDAGDKFMQGIFLPYGITTDDNTTAIRDGGFGSTGN